MGRDKALLPFHGATLGQTVAEVVGAAAGQVYMVGKNQPYPFRCDGFISDIYAEAGPLGGIISALQWTPADWNLIVACDMPALKIDFLRQMLDVAEQSAADAVIPAGPSGRLEPVCAAYHRRSLQGLSSAFARGVRKIAVALEDVRIKVWRVPEVACFQNVNTPEEWAPYES